jgi:hypothetical protein
MKIQLPHIPDDWDRVATVLILFIIVAIMFALSGCTVVTDYGVATMGDATKLSYRSKLGATFGADTLNHSAAIGIARDAAGTAAMWSGIKSLANTAVDATGTNLVSDAINK